MRCGLCLPACPTYLLTGLEKSSPRGRIRLMKAVDQEEMKITNGFTYEMNFCLDCQACESVCPAGVKYGSLVESARAQIADSGFESWTTKMLRWLLLRKLFEVPHALALSVRMLRFIEMSGMATLLRKTRFLSLFSENLHQALGLLPAVSKRPSSKTLLKKAVFTTAKQIRIGFLTGCVMDVLFADVNADTVELLEHHGCEVIIPCEQGCCGSLQAHNGDPVTARTLAAQNVRAFSGQGLDTIVMNSAGCGAFMKQYAALFEDDPELAAPAAELAAKTKDISEFLFDVGLRVRSTSQVSVPRKRVTYHDACHLVHSQKVSEQPRQLLRSIPSTEYVELPEATWCCGSAGIYNITHAETASELLDRKMENIKRIAPDIIVTGNPGCLLQLQQGLDERGLHVELLHLATFLRRTCCD